MKLSTLLLAILLTLGWNTPSKAQLIESQPFNSSGDATFTITLTTSGPLNVLAATGGYLSVYVDGTHVANGPNYNGYITVVDYATSTNLAAGSHTIEVTGAGGANGAATLIAANEPPSGATASSSQLQSQITSLQSSESDDAANINYLLTTGTAQGNQISTLQTNESSDATVIAALQGQLTTIQTTLQGELNQNSVAITTLQSRITADEATITHQQSEIDALQTQSGDNSGTLDTLQQQQAATASQQQTDETTLATLQSQQSAIQSTLGTLQTQLANDEAAQATENTTLQNEITALQNRGISSTVTSSNNSSRLTRDLTYAGIGLGLAGIGTGIGAIVSDSGTEDTKSTSTDALTDPATGR